MIGADGSGPLGTRNSQSPRDSEMSSGRADRSTGSETVPARMQPWPYPVSYMKSTAMPFSVHGPSATTWRVVFAVGRGVAHLVRSETER